jgi:hypothetical protein
MNELDDEDVKEAWASIIGAFVCVFVLLLPMFL